MSTESPQSRIAYYGATLRANRFDDLSVTETIHPAYDRIESHFHPTPFVTFVLCGSYDESRDGDEERCEAGCAVFHEAGERHADRFGRCETRLLNVAWMKGASPPLPRTRVVRGPAPKRLAMSLINEVSRGVSGCRVVIESLIAEIATLGQAETPTSNEPPAWLRRVEERIRDEYRNLPRLEELARGAGVHRAHLARAFRQHYGMTVGDLARDLRLQWARTRLSRGSSIAEVAIEAGFADQSHMTRWFKQRLGQTPGRYQRS